MLWESTTPHPLTHSLTRTHTTYMHTYMHTHTHTLTHSHTHTHLCRRERVDLCQRPGAHAHALAAVRDGLVRGLAHVAHEGAVLHADVAEPQTSGRLQTRGQ